MALVNYKWIINRWGFRWVRITCQEIFCVLLTKTVNLYTTTCICMGFYTRQKYVVYLIVVRQNKPSKWERMRRRNMGWVKGILKFETIKLRKNLFKNKQFTHNLLIISDFFLWTKKSVKYYIICSLKAPVYCLCKR